MAIDFEKLFRIDIRFPGIMFGYHAWALNAYLDSLEEIVTIAQERYSHQGERDLESKIGDLHPELYGQRLSEIHEAADYHIPRFARLSALVSIWGFLKSQ